MPDPSMTPPGGAQQAPFGTSSATQPTPNAGYEAAAAQKLGSVIKQLEEIIPLAGAATEIGKAALDALTKLVKLVPPGSVTPASEKNNLESMMVKNTQSNQQMQALKPPQAAAPTNASPALGLKVA